ncbi:GNAT family N-acetyltransferase [Comamonas sp. AG1104]|uniref:GNAT family N-acetyltransferase n=1 Tax=Comamonas sp. AG1104 TaxID=2183900 RepID=UPI000E2A9EF7|nr:GNAT family N-acetyltransferase [Comamonas sp. AG1104]RDI12696.1 acetyltransferase (GNAT) family protein [Comamonas sp. AG1104]
MYDRIDKYRTLCTQEPSIPLFSQAWWLDATAGEGAWDVALVEKGGAIVAAMPYVPRKRYGFTLLGQPALTQTLGPWLRETDGKSSTKLAQHKDWLQALIDQLPHFSHFTQNWHWRMGNWLPFYWAGFQQTTRYTYILQELSDEQELWQGLQENIRREIKKASNRLQLRVRDDLTVDDFLVLNRMTFARQDMALPYTEAFVHKLDQACVARQARKIFIAEDEQGRRHAGVYVVWDGNSAYYLMGGGDPELRNSGATSLCMWEAIKFAATVTKRFDFEGSMIEPVEKFFRAFGAQQTPYFTVSKTPSFILKTALFARSLKEAK